VGTNRGGRKFASLFGRLRNSTIFAAQKLGLEQCSPTPPEEAGELKRGLIAPVRPHSPRFVNARFQINPEDYQ